jgi:hypothetical protein
MTRNLFQSKDRDLNQNIQFTFPCSSFLIAIAMADVPNSNFDDFELRPHPHTNPRHSPELAGGRNFSQQLIYVPLPTQGRQGMKSPGCVFDMTATNSSWNAAAFDSRN